MISTPYDHIAEKFHAERNRFRPSEEEYLTLLLAPAARGSTVLDLGCGTGTPMAEWIAARGHRLVGVDGSAAMLAIARKRLPAHRWVHAYIEQVEFDKTFAAIVCWDALFHLPARHFAPVIRKMHRWLEPGGRLLVSSGGSPEDGGVGFVDTMFGHKFSTTAFPRVEWSRRLRKRVSRSCGRKCATRRMVFATRENGPRWRQRGTERSSSPARRA